MSSSNSNQPFFQAVNYYLMLLGAFLILLGILLMIGGRSEDPSVFDRDAIYGFQRLTLAPITIMLGFVLEVVAILYRKKPSK